MIDFLQEISYTVLIKLVFPRLSVRYVRKEVFPFGFFIAFVGCRRSSIVFPGSCKKAAEGGGTHPSTNSVSEKRLSFGLKGRFSPNFKK